MGKCAGEPMNIIKWIEENKGSFVPPVCNEVMYEDQLKIMFVGGPNVRKDFHIEEGEEFFYMVKGDMCLKIMEKGIPKDIPIKEGEIFILPRRIPHSPQRQKDTIGLVIERERLENETDVLRYYCEDNSTVLYEAWFHCSSIVEALPPVIKGFMESEQRKTGKPIPAGPNFCTQTQYQIFIHFKWLDDHKSQICPKGEVTFHDGIEFKVHVYGGGDYEHDNGRETWLWQLEGEATVTMDNESKCLKKGDCWIIPSGSKFSVKRNDNSIGLALQIDVPKHE